MNETHEQPEGHAGDDTKDDTKKREHLAEVIELHSKVTEAKETSEAPEVSMVMEGALEEVMDGIENDPNTAGWFKRIGNLSKDAKIFFAGEAAMSFSSAVFSVGSFVEASRGFSQGRTLDTAAYTIVAIITALVSLGSGVRARRYGTVKDPSKLSWAENEAQ